MPLTLILIAITIMVRIQPTKADNDNEYNGLDADTDDLSWAEAKMSDQNVDKKDVPRPEKTEVN